MRVRDLTPPAPPDMRVRDLTPPPPPDMRVRDLTPPAPPDMRVSDLTPPDTRVTSPPAPAVSVDRRRPLTSSPR